MIQLYQQIYQLHANSNLIRVEETLLFLIEALRGLYGATIGN